MHRINRAFYGMVAVIAFIVIVEVFLLVQPLQVLARHMTKVPDLQVLGDNAVQSLQLIDRGGCQH